MTSGSMPGATSSRWSRAVGVAVVDVPDVAEQDQPVDGAPAPDRDQPVDGGATREIGGVVYLAPLPDGPVAVLAGASAVLYRALVATGGEDPVARVARDLGVPVEEVDPEAIQEFAEELREGGFIIPRAPDPSAG
ncbi:hypothetical protein MWU75_08800 [Ornithinimicrobium sp. F0845]|uniref:hypothetical protein n=1 Tax=Ornithinimicrobium sp. F0845 TaxID=2926412 RepID=UPI001FF586FC|nr:hypothetical protein [Ornithinimicrobium sp. F0845]MCK0112233.1 hypothetical protein [Ornithinimicrobium sp. F0845]